jgi:hypothetical protein
MSSRYFRPLNATIFLKKRCTEHVDDSTQTCNSFISKRFHQQRAGYPTSLRYVKGSHYLCWNEWRARSGLSLPLVNSWLLL